MSGCPCLILGGVTDHATGAYLPLLKNNGGFCGDFSVNPACSSTDTSNIDMREQIFPMLNTSDNDVANGRPSNNGPSMLLYSLQLEWAGR